MAQETNPRLVFERLFAADQRQLAERAAGERSLLKKSLLDYVADDARRIQRQLGRGDQRKLDEFLTSVREIERRIEQAESSDVETIEAPNAFAKPNGVPDDHGEHIRLMSDMIVLAFQADLTRVASLMFGRAGSNLSYRKIGVPDGHHNLSHHGGNPEKLEKIARINRYHMQQFAHMLQRLESIPEGDGTLLDHSMIMYGSGLGDGNRHTHEDLPVLLAGRGSGTIQPGRHIVYDEETPMSNLFLSMLDRFGTPTDSFADSTGRLSQLG